MKRKYRYQVQYLDRKKDYKCFVKYFISLYGVKHFLEINSIYNYCVIDMNNSTEVLI